MRAAVLTGFGGPECLTVRVVPTPEPAPGEVLVRVGAAGMNNTDIWTREGAYGSGSDPDAVQGWLREPLNFPVIQGMDIAGRVVAAGRVADERLVGERVLVEPMLYADPEGTVVEGLIGSERDGGFAEFVSVPAANVHPVNGVLSAAELATFPTAYGTALRMLNRARVAAGETLLVTGASGGVGSGLVQLAVAKGARVIAVVGPGKEERARSLGAHAVLRRDIDDLVPTVSSTVEESIDVVADVVGGPSFPALLDVLRPFGRYVTAGAIAGPLVGLDLRTLYLKQLELIGSTVATRAEFAELVRLIDAGAVRPLLAATYPLADIHRAQEDFLAKDFFGKLVLTPSRSDP